MLINQHSLLTIISIKDNLPEEAKPLLKKYCDIASVLISREAYDKGIIFELTDADIRYSNHSDTELSEIFNLLFKKIILQYGNCRNTKTSAEI